MFEDQVATIDARQRDQVSRQNAGRSYLVSQQPYHRPPITEAVIEIRFSTPVDQTSLDKVNSDFASSYPLQQTVRNLEVAFGVPPKIEDSPTAQVNQAVGRRRSSEDLSEIIVLWPLAFEMAQLAPYPGWRDFFERFDRDWNIWKRNIGYRKIGRIGVRFINRIDIPLIGTVIEESDYLRVYPKLPESLGPMTTYGLQAQLPPDDKGFKVTLNSASVPSPLLNHGSLILDQDVAVEINVPQNDQEIYTLLDQIRAKKNAVFEDCVTPRARELFQS